MGAIGLSGIRKVFPDGTVAVNDVDLEIDDGEFVVFVGPSGCGKTTLLRLISGLETMTAGEIRFDGQVINDVSPRERNMAMVFQNYALYPHMTVRQNIAFALRVRKFRQAEIAERVNEAARILDLDQLLDRKPKQLSGGQRQRVAMGRAIVRHPGAFLLDEPLSNLDAKLRVQLRTELRRLHERLGVTTIHVTHDQVEAMTLGDRVAIFSEGSLQQYDTPQALYRQPANIFVAGFIGSPAMNFIEAVLAGSGARATASIGGTEITLGPLSLSDGAGPGDRVLLGVRPEHLGWRRSENGASGVLQARVELVEHIEPEAHVSASLVDPAVVVRTADEFVGDSHEDTTALAHEDTRFLTLRVSADEVPERGEVIDLIMAGDRIRLFDLANGDRLGHKHEPRGPQRGQT